MVARLFGCLVLLALSVNSLLRCQRSHLGVDTAFITLTFVNPFPSFSFVTIPDVTVDSTFTALLVKEWSTTRYNIPVLLSVFGVYIYRDIWPLATFTKEPKYLEEAYMLWIKFSMSPSFPALIYFLSS